MAKNSNEKSRFPLVLGIIISITILGVLATYLIYSIHYSKRWYRNTVINGIDVSGQTLLSSKEMLIDANRDYAMHIVARNDGSIEIDGDSIGYTFDTGENFEQTFQKQHEKSAVFRSSDEYNLEYDVSFDASKLEEQLKSSELLKGSDNYKIKKPVSAYVDFSKEDKQFVCVPEEIGNKLNKKKFIEAVEESLRQAMREIDLSDESAFPEVYEKPEVTSSDEALIQERDAYNEAALRYVSWNMEEGVTEQITPQKIIKWITYKDGKIVYDEEKVAAWVESFCLKYKTVGKTRSVKCHTGEKIKVAGGDYGWQMDYQNTVEQAKKALKEKIDSEAVKKYMEDPSAKNKKAITIKKKVKYLNTAFQRDYENFAVDWDTDNYTEVSIADQMVYVFRKGKIAFQCRCITGRPVPGRETPRGTYFIKEHREAYTLTGADYSTPVVNWVRITWTGTGFHPATWQPWGSWSKELYKTRGSHGCVNLAPADAATIYKMTSYREAVFIH